MDDPESLWLGAGEGEFSGDILALMHRDHSKMRLLIDRALANRDAGTLLRTEFLEEVWKHEFAEVSVFWPALRDALPSSREMVQMWLDTDHATMDVITRLDSMERTDPKAEVAVFELARTILEHIMAEEREGWPQATSALSLERLADLGDRFLEMKARATMPRHRVAEVAPGDVVAETLAAVPKPEAD